MPKVITREKDLTSAGSQQYRNFTVLVPGYVVSQNFDNVADENGVYEVSSLTDFSLNVGIIKEETTVLSEGSFATIKPTTAGSADELIQNVVDDLGEDVNIFTKLTIETVADNNILHSLYYVKGAETTPDINKKGYIKVKIGGNVTYLVATKISNISWTTDAGTYVSLTDGSETYDGIVALTSEGSNGLSEDSNYHYGNKMAAELLALGYTVLYKKMTDIAQLATDSFWKPLKDKSIYDFRYAVTGLIKEDLEASKKIFDLCKFTLGDDSDAIEDTGRGDCYALIDIDESIYTNGINQYDAVAAIKNSDFYKGYFTNEFGKYAVILTPSVEYVSLANNYSNTQMPASFHYLACAAKAFRSYNEWYAVAGYNRGVSDLVVKSTKVKFGDYAVNALQPRKRDTACSAINIICNIRNNYYIWGNRTAFYDKAEAKSPTGLVASDFLNIRQLCTTIKKQLYFVCRRFTFDPNSDVLWVNFISSITPLLEAMKADQGLTAYKIVKIKTDQKGKMMARIRIVPIEAVEDFDICLTLEDSVGGTVVSFND